MNTVDLHENLTLAYSTIADGNMDERFSDRSVIMANRRKFFNQFGLNPKMVIEAKQIGGDRILLLNNENTQMWYGVNIPGVDGFITDQTTVGLLLKVADCVPVVIYDPDHRALGVFHTGWQGAVKNIPTKGLAKMVENYGTDPAKAVVWLGPSAHNCCFTSAEKPNQIDDPAWKAYLSETAGQWHVDVVSYIIDSLKTAGVKKGNCTIDPHCTVESTELFSHQRSKSTGEAEGRFLVLAKLR